MRSRTEPTFEPVEPVDEIAKIVDYASTALPLPADYFSQIGVSPYSGGTFPDVQPVRTFRETHIASWGQSPMHRIMTGCHSETSPELQERLWADEDWRNVIRWVFQNIRDLETARSRAELFLDHGYWQAIAATILRALDEDLVGKQVEAYAAHRAYLDAVWAKKYPPKDKE